MAEVYFVTGKLGSGKSLTAVGKIREALCRGVPVATNLDINLSPMIGRDKKNTRLLRMPDKPSVEDLYTIGTANRSYDTSKDGLIVLDECGTWFNSRTWNDKGRQQLIDHLLHIRKLGWDVIFIVQDISMVDKQARVALAEHTVFCRRLDRLPLPIIGPLVSILTFGNIKLKLPKLHVGIVKYGDNTNSLTVDKWMLWGTDLYAAYDTKQMFRANYPHGTYSVLPPAYIRKWYTRSAKFTLGNCMRLTKIVMRKYSRITAFLFGVVGTFAIMTFTAPTAKDETQTANATAVETEQAKSPPKTLDLSGYKIVSYMRAPNQPLYFEIDKGANRLSSIELASLGYRFESISKCHINIIQGESSEPVFCQSKSRI